ncbi:MAG: peptidase C39 [Clostridia bacterium]|nr:peptidase C39 [Clostridia bacterium]
MKTPLHYQISEYDCGPTTMMNAMSFLFTREQLLPEIVQHIMLYSLDAYNAKGETGKSGTSRMAMMFLSNWLKEFGKACHFPIDCQYLSGSSVYLGGISQLTNALHCNGAVIVRLNYGGDHYVLLTGQEGDQISMFDPYFRKRPFIQKDIILLDDEPFTRNRIVPEARLNEKQKNGIYALGPTECREAILIFNQDTRLTAESTIEYFI